MSSKCYVDNSTIFAAMMSLPLGKAEKFKLQIDLWFQKYQRQLYENLSSKPDDGIFPNYFSPAFYVTFGVFDFAVLSPINMYNFGTQNFPLFSPHLFQANNIFHGMKSPLCCFLIPWRTWEPCFMQYVK